MTTRKRRSGTKKSSGATALKSAEPVIRETAVLKKQEKKPEVQVQEASQEQILASQLFQEKDIRTQYMRRVAQLQKEVVELRVQLNDAHEKLILYQIDKMNKESVDLLTSVGLELGDSVTDKLEGREGEWLVIKK